MVLLHGLGSNADDLYPVAKQLVADFGDAEFLIPDGFHASPNGGREWWSFQGMTEANRMKRLRTAADELTPWLEARLKERSLGFEQLVLLGFSQGAALSSWVGAHRTLAGAVSWCGRGVSDGDSAVRTPMLLINGGADPMVSPEDAQAFAETLKSRQAPVTFSLHPALAHSLDRQSLEETRGFLRQALRGE